MYKIALMRKIEAGNHKISDHEKVSIFMHIKLWKLDNRKFSDVTTTGFLSNKFFL